MLGLAGIGRPQGTGTCRVRVSATASKKRVVWSPFLVHFKHGAEFE
jgi:hypothetical protein